MRTTLRDHTVLIHQRHDGQYVFHYVRKKTFVIGVGPSCDLIINTAVPYQSFHRTRFCTLERRRQSQETFIKVPEGVPVQVNGRAPTTNELHLLPSGAQLTFPTTAENSPVKGCISYQYMNITPDSVFDVFRLQDCIGQGGFGRVFDALHKESKVKYAVKMVRKPRQILPRGVEDPVDREIAILKEISHPSIVKLYDVYAQGHTYFLAMELMPEGSLQDLLREERRLVDSDARLFTLDVCAALAYLHAKGIVHRDIKPGNILVCSRTPLSVKVADFGIAKMIDQETYLQTMCGTPDFMAPEISRQERYDCKVDTWALGVTLFLMLSGCSPFSHRAENPFFNFIGVATPDIQWDRLPDGTDKSSDKRQLVTAMLTVQASDRPSPSEIPLYAWFQDGPRDSPMEYASRSCASVSNHMSEMVQRLGTFASLPQAGSIRPGSAVLPAETGRPQACSVGPSSAVPRTGANSPQAHSIASSSAVPTGAGRPHLVPPPDPQAEVRSAYSPESQKGLAAEKGIVVKQWLWSLAVVCVLALLYNFTKFFL